MDKILQIIADNTQTFYRYDTGERIYVWPRLLMMAIVSIILSMLTHGNVDALINGLIPVQAILLGFNFTVMFFLVSAGAAEASSDSIEAVGLATKINKLSTELFRNVSYFNICAIVCIILSLCLLMRTPDFGFLAHIISPRDFLKFNSLHDCVVMVGRVSVRSALYFLLIEGIFTFFRLIIRINYLFEQKITLR